MPFITLHLPDWLEDTNGQRVQVAGRIEVDEQGRVVVAPPPQDVDQDTVVPPDPPIQQTNGG